jgi:hypothetical protein
MHNASIPTERPLELIRSHAKEWTAKNPGQALNLYALVDAAQDRMIWQRLLRHSQQAEALLGNRGSPTDALSPHLIGLGSALALAPEIEKSLTARHSTAAFDGGIRAVEQQPAGFGSAKPFRPIHGRALAG